MTYTARSSRSSLAGLLASLWLFPSAQACTSISPQRRAFAEAQATPGCQDRIRTYGRRLPGFLTADEWSASNWDQLLSTLRLTSRDVLTQEEYVQAKPPFARDEATSYFRRWSRGRPSISRFEAARLERNGFLNLDMNRDGMLSLAECLAYRPIPLDIN